MDDTKVFPAKYLIIFGEHLPNIYMREITYLAVLSHVGIVRFWKKYFVCKQSCRNNFRRRLAACNANKKSINYCVILCMSHRNYVSFPVIRFI